MASLWNRLARLVTTRRSTWVLLVIGLAVAGALSAGLRDASPPDSVQALPSGSDSAAVQKLEKRFPDHELSPVTAVVTRDDGARLAKSDLTATNKVGKQLGHQVDRHVSSAITAKDHRAAVINVMINADRSNSEIAPTIKKLRSVAHDSTPDGLTVRITGGPAFGADIASAFDGANFTLLAVTVGIVAILLLITYRSPILWLVPLAVVGLADQVAGAVTAKLGEAAGLQFDAGIISVLVFGAGTNYALLLISRYREELYRHPDHRTALAAAVRGTGAAILTSNITVVVSLLTLLLAAMPNTRGLGVAAAVGLAIALVFVLAMLPAALAICGRRIFWPFVPQVGAAPRQGRFWHRAAVAVRRRPGRAALGSVVILAVLASGLLGTKVGLSQLEQFRVPSESASGLKVMSQHFPAGESAPTTVIANKSASKDVIQQARHVSNVQSVRPAGTSGDLVKLRVVGKAKPGSDASLDMVHDLRTTVSKVPDADAKVGGQDAQDVDVRSASKSDLLTVAPLILGVALVLLMALLRAVLGPALLVLINVMSAVAAIGAGTWGGTVLFNFPALDVNVPLMAFLFLVALGIDYTIFLMHRARHEAARFGTRDGVVAAVSHTGAVITSAGVVLAGVFAALGVLPLTTLAQLGLIVGIGVLVDTLLVRCVLVPAIVTLAGDRTWWPASLRDERASRTESRGTANDNEAADIQATDRTGHVRTDG